MSTATQTPSAPWTQDRLHKAWQMLTQADPKLRIRNAADELGVGEAQLLSTRLGQGVTRLSNQWAALIEGVEALGEVMALTRNQHAVHEKVGTYQNIDIGPHVGLVLDKDIDLRIFVSQWAYGFAVENEDARSKKVRHSLQFFDKHGTAVHKIFMRPTSDMDAYKTLVATHRSDDQQFIAQVEPAPTPKSETPDEEIDVEGFQQNWKDLQDTHDFFGMLRKFGVGRTQALRLAPEGFSWKVKPESLRQTLQQASADDIPIMVFVGNRGMIQIHTGPVNKLLETGPWYNVLDPGFNLHLREDAIDTAWVVRKPTVDGVVTSLELFDKDGGNIAMLFGERKPGIKELLTWRQVAESLPRA